MCYFRDSVISRFRPIRIKRSIVLVICNKARKPKEMFANILLNFLFHFLIENKFPKSFINIDTQI